MVSRQIVQQPLAAFVARATTWTVALALVLLASVPGAFAETKSDREKAARALVRSALACEIDGQGDRSKLLAAALEKAPEQAAAHWQSGQVYWNKRWLDYEQVCELPDYQATLADYRGQRAAAPLTVAGQMELADWCFKHGLVEQRQAHLAKVLELDPDHAAARSQLGYLRIGDRWLNRRDIAAARERDFQSRQALAHWKALLDSIQAGLNSGVAANRAKAHERLLAIRDPQAIPALEFVISSTGDEPAREVVETLAAMRGPEAAVGLARHAVYTPWYSVGEFAAQKLKGREEHDYIPTLLAALFTPVKGARTIYYDSGTLLLQRYSFFREGQGRNQQLLVDSTFGIWMMTRDGQGLLPSLAALQPGLVNGGETEGQQLAILASRELQGRVEVELFNVEKTLQQQNEATQALNERICRVLTAVSGQKLPADPQAWWSWWNDHNEVYYQGQKPTDTVYVRQTSILPISVQSDRPRSRCECLAAGTEVWTDSGPRAIEQMQTGDRVLAQNPQTGELAYQAVLRPTKRKAEPLVTIQLEQQMIRSTGGHPFWVAGQGWTLARALKPGMRLHTPAGGVEILAMGEAAAEPTFNLIVADFHNYFVGAQRVLSHDNTVREPTHGGLPGMEDGSGAISAK